MSARQVLGGMAIGGGAITAVICFPVALFAWSVGESALSGSNGSGGAMATALLCPAIAVVFGLVGFGGVVAAVVGALGARKRRGADPEG